MSAALTVQRCAQVADGISKAFPNFSFAVTSSLTVTAFVSGNHLFDHEGLRAYKLLTMNMAGMSQDELKEKIFILIQDSKFMTDMTARRDYLNEKLKAKFPGYAYLLIIADQSVPYSFRNFKAYCEFDKSEYGHQILLMLA